MVKCQYLAYHFNREDLTTNVGQIDKEVERLLHNVKVPGSKKRPIKIYGDGNYLARVGSMFAYGSEEYHLDVRLRIVMELVMHRDYYLDAEKMAMGWPSGQTPHPTPVQIAQYSESFVGEVLT